MKYAILVYETPEELSERAGEKAQAYWAAYTQYGQMLSAAGAITGGAGLKGPETATTLRLRGGHRELLDGPYAETKEQLGGVFIIDVESLDAALDWAAKCPAAARGVVEIRPLLAM